MSTTSSFVPADYEVSSGGSNFFKPKAGENKFRILSDALVGKEGWKDNTPFRRAGTDAVIDESEVDVETNPKTGKTKPKINDFMAFYVYDYFTGKIAIASFTQAGIKKAILSYAQNEEWGHPSNYDLNLKKSGEGLLTKYELTPSPAKALAKEVQEVVDAAKPSFDLAHALSVE